ncbi:MAG: hypothetical protein HYZ28_26695 [Myxococcales bacterium]|nr:hypothetical protein [Myxococcales bacterium]
MHHLEIAVCGGAPLLKVSFHDARRRWCGVRLGVDGTVKWERLVSSPPGERRRRLFDDLAEAKVTPAEALRLSKERLPGARFDTVGLCSDRQGRLAWLLYLSAGPASALAVEVDAGGNGLFVLRTDPLTGQLRREP